MRLQSYVAGEWYAGERGTVPLLDASTSEVIAEASSEGIDMGAVHGYARSYGGPALRGLTFHERAAALKALAAYLLERKEEFYKLSYATGATRNDSWIDIEGGIGTLFAYSSKARRELPDGHVYLEGEPETLSKQGSFVGQHICVPLEGAAVHINAFNFPIWGMLEKLAPALIAGVPAIVKPATATSYLTQRVFQSIIESRLLPPGAVQLICGSLGDLLDRLDCQDSVSFTGSASTALKLRSRTHLIESSVRFVAETDSLNSSILGSDAAPGTPEFDLFVKEVTREMTVKAGQKCTAIRKAIVPRAHSAELVRALQASLARVVVGDPRTEGVRMGPLASLSQRDEVLARVGELESEARRVTDGVDANASGRNARGAFMAPILLYCDAPRDARKVHDVEAFGPVCTVLPYEDAEDAINLARRGQGSLVGSIFTADENVGRELTLGLAPFHGRLLIVNRDCSKESTGHGSPLPNLIHGGPGRAGGGEELGGIRGVLHYMQRTALQSSPAMIAAITGRWIRGGTRRDPGKHLFRKTFHELEIGDGLTSAEREVTIEDIERFAALSGDRFYAHMNEAEAQRNPFFGGRVAHGYFLISAAAGLFVDPAIGPVLANYGIDSLRFLAPVKPGDRIRVHLTCKQKTLRKDKGYGEVRWDAQIVNQRDETVATYDVLTMVSETGLV